MNITASRLKIRLSVAGEGRRPAVVKAWSKAQNQQTRAYLDKLPDHAAIEKTIDEMVRENVAELFLPCLAAGNSVRDEVSAAKQQPILVTLASANDLKSEKVVIDPNALDAKGKTTIDWFVPSLDGKIRGGLVSKAGARMAHSTFTRRPRAKPCRTRSRMCNIRPPAAARPGTRTARHLLHPVSAQGRAAGR